MLNQKQGFPEENEIVICTVKKILPHGVFVSFIEYKDKEGLIHISEISPGRVRNIRDFVEEGKQIVCKILRVDKERNNLGLTLRRVTQSQRINKNTEYKQEQKAEKILEILAKQSGTKLDKKIEKLLLELIREKIKKKEVKISATITLSSPLPNGINVIKELMKNIRINGTRIIYLGAPRYRLILTADDYKTAEKHLSEIEAIGLKAIKDKGIFKIERYDKRNT